MHQESKVTSSTTFVCMSAIEIPFFDQINQKSWPINVKEAWCNNDKGGKLSVGILITPNLLTLQYLYRSRLQFTPYLLMGLNCNLSIQCDGLKGIMHISTNPSLGTSMDSGPSSIQNFQEVFLVLQASQRGGY